MNAGESVVGRVAIWNPASGSAPNEADLRAALGPEAELVETTEDDPGAGQATDAVQRNAKIVVACGGDGTVRACLDALAGSETALAVVPLGTGNLLASNLGLADGLGAAEGIGQGARRSVDLGRVNGEAFSVMAGSGLDALMIRDANPKLKSKLGTTAYVISAAKNLRTSLVRTTVDVDGQRWFEGRTSMVLVGNFGTISGGVEVFPDAQPDDGKLDIAIMTANSLREWIAVGWSLVRGKQPPLKLAQRTQGREISVSLAKARPYELDGEDRESTSVLNFEAQPNALTIHQTGDQ